MTTSAVEREDAWLSIGAADKAQSVVELARDLPIVSVLEIGCGTGAVLSEIIRRRVGSEYGACEPATALFEQARQRHYEADVDLRCGTFESSGLAARRWDLIVISHVLEHVPDPAGLLARALREASHVVVEVPIEGTRMGDLRSRVRQAVTGRGRTDNDAGHIQFFSINDVERMVRWTGGDVIRSRTYFPEAAYRHMAEEATGWRDRYYGAWVAAHRLLGPRVLTRLYYGHYAVLATPATPAGQPHPLFWSA